MGEQISGWVGEGRWLQMGSSREILVTTKSCILILVLVTLIYR